MTPAELQLIRDKLNDLENPVEYTELRDTAGQLIDYAKDLVKLVSKYHQQHDFVAQESVLCWPDDPPKECPCKICKTANQLVPR